MLHSPCRNCPKRHMDKNICARSCKLLKQLQRLQAYRKERILFPPAVDSADEDRYTLSIAIDLSRPTLEELSL